MTTWVMLIAVLGTVATLGAHMARAAVQLTLTYLALRNTTPAQRLEILYALGSALAAINCYCDAALEAGREGPPPRRTTQHPVRGR